MKTLQSEIVSVKQLEPGETVLIVGTRQTVVSVEILPKEPYSSQDARLTLRSPETGRIWSLKTTQRATINRVIK